jgi:hypothetical protein
MLPSSPKEIAVAITTWGNWPSFSGEKCICGYLANVLAGGPGWECPLCKHFNIQSFSCHNMPWISPVIGPTRDTISSGGKLYQKCGEIAIKKSPKIGETIKVDGERLADLNSQDFTIGELYECEVVNYWLIAGHVYVFVRRPDGHCRSFPYRQIVIGNRELY